MTVPGSANPLLLRSAAPTAYQVSRSLRFNSADSAYLSRVPSSTSTTTTWTWSAWVKRSTLGSKGLFGAYYGNMSRYFLLRFSSSDQIDVFGGDYSTSSTTTNVNLITTSVYRDTSAWMHIVFTYDTTNGTSSDRARLYVNNIRVTTFSTEVYPGSSSSTFVNYNTATHYLGAWWTGSEFFDGYLANVEFIAGTALTPSSFAETDATTGQWVPKLFSGSYGTNGFKLTFADNSNNTASTLGADTSGNGNNWTPNNLSVTAGAGNDALTDSPTSYGSGTSGGDVRGNFCTLNPLFSSTTLTNGNLDAEGPSNAWHIGRGTIAFPTSDKWYWEATVTGTASASYAISVATAAAANSVADVTTATGLYGIVNNTGTTTTKFVNGTASTISTAAAWAQNDILMCAYDGATGKVWFGRNGTWYPPTSGGSAGNPSAGTNETMTASGTVFPAVHCYGTSGDMTVNFGQRAFLYTPPANHKPLVDTYLPTPTVAKPSTAMDVLLWSGTGGNRSFSSLNMSPDFVWIKQRNQAFSTGHQLYDIVRGAGSDKELNSAGTAAEGAGNIDQYGWLSSFDSNGFSVTAGPLGADYVNASGTTYVAWAWDAGTSTVTNTQGSISSQVRANASAGFSIVSWTSDGSTSIKTCGHGLGVKPSLIIFKNRDLADQWGVLHSSFADQTKNWMRLNTTDAVLSSGAFTYFSYDSTTFGIKQNEFFSNTHRGIAYCFAPVANYSSFGSYTGNGSSTDGPFVFTGHRSRFLLIKRTDGSANYWSIIDTARSASNVANAVLYPNASDAESTINFSIDVLSNGFKLRSASSDVNVSNGTYIYAAFAENPFQYARAR